MLLQDEIDLGLVPVAIIPKLKSYYINTDYCIGCDGPTASVCLFSETPIDKVEKVLLDHQSRTSVVLAKILLKEYWKIQPELIDAGEDFREFIKGTTAGLVIGDRALQQRKHSAYVYDLGEAWKQLTGLPFVFAAWISNKKLSNAFVEEFNIANGLGLHNIDAVLEELDYDDFDLHDYYSRYIKYDLNAAKREGLDLFLKKLIQNF
jgi:chorismate dehydratase